MLRVADKRFTADAVIIDSEVQLQRKEKEEKEEKKEWRARAGRVDVQG